MKKIKLNKSQRDSLTVEIYLGRLTINQFVEFKEVVERLTGQTLTFEINPKAKRKKTKA